MANPGVGSKFVSVNLNKSYGQQQQQQQRSTSTSTSSPGGGNRIRSGGVGNGIVGGGGGMVLLSRWRSTIVGVQKGGPKLSIPPPLNLPSLRKEHERFDSSSSGGASSGAGNSGAGARPISSSIGWTKPAPAPAPAELPLEKDTGIGNDHPLGVGSLSVNSSDLARGNNSVYMPPSARSVFATGQSAAALPTNDFPPAQRAAVLRGEDFPSLQATIPSVVAMSQKQKDTPKQKLNQKASGELDEKMGNSYLRPTQAQNQSSRLIGKPADDKEGVNHRFSGSRNNEQSRKQDDFFSSPLPLVRFNHTSDWADDERDTGHGIPDQDRDQGYLRNEFYRERDFDFPRISVPPRTSHYDHSEGRGLHQDDVGRPPSGGFLRGNTYNRDVRSPNREGHDVSSWRAPSLAKDGFTGYRNGIAARSLPMNRDNSKESKYGRSPFGNSGRDGFSSGLSATQDSRFGRKDMDYGQGIRQAGNHMTDSYSGRGNEQTKLDYYGSDLPNCNRSNSSQNGSFIKTSGTGSFGNDPIFGSSREKRLTSGKQYLEEPFMKDFDSGPDFDGTFVAVFKRKKDLPRQADYHDPARESFEAELERVQKLQEQERQRVIEEQTRALELARKEEEDRERVALEEEERKRRIEEEVREAAWRAEQEHLEAIRRAEEQKVAREEEKRRMLLEEERRKEAATQKLLELEARIARRQAENTKAMEFSPAARDERMSGVFNEKDLARVADVVDWEDGERMVERITSSASSDSSSLNRSLEMNSRPNLYRDGDSIFSERGKPSNYWRRDAFENGSSSTFNSQDQDNGYRSPNRDVYGLGMAFARKEHNGGHGIITAKTSARGGLVEPPFVDDFPHLRGNRWNLGADGDPYTRHSDINPEFHDNFSERFNDAGWGIGRPQGHHHSFYPERPFQNSDTDGFSSFGKSRHSTRQPRVPPPPSLAAMNKNTFRSQTEPPSSSTFSDSEMNYQHATRRSEQISLTGYGDSYEEELDQSREVETQRENTSSQDQKGAKTTTPRCDSQSSLSVSSPPSSPTHLSHDDLDDSSESLVLPTATEEDKVHLSEDEHSFSDTKMSTASKVEAVSSASLVEDEEWDIEDHLDLPEQEEYDEEENYREEDEVQEEDDENVELPQEFEDLHLEEKDSSIKDQLVLGFDESVDVVMPSGDYSERVSEEAGSPDGLVHIGQNLQSENTLPKVRVESSGTNEEAEEKLQNLGTKPGTDVHSSDASTGVLLDAIDASSTLSLPPHQLQTSPVDVTLPSSTTEPTVSAVSVTSSQPEMPVKLQFGLFTGPSLIPSPVPAIQIGSIQMPLHIHPQVGPPLNQMHPPQPPFFQFGQLRYASPISQGILPLGPQSMSFVQSSTPGQFSFKQNQNGSSSNQDVQDPSVQNHSMGDKLSGISVDDQPGVQKLLEQSQEYPCKEVNMLSVRQGASHRRENTSLIGDRNMRPESTSQVDPAYRYFDNKKSYRSSFNNKEMHGQPPVESNTSRFVSKAPGPTSGSKGKRYSTVKNSWARPSPPVSEYPPSDFRGFQRRARPKLPRTEFRVRENVDKRQSETLISSHDPQPETPTFSGSVSGTSVQSGVKENFGNKTSKQLVDTEGLNSEVPSKNVTSLYISHSREGNPKRNNSFDEDIDAPLRSGVVRVFKQPGIEAPSDDDDFIEVRSKRQMLNDRREQREKEIKAKAKIIKAPKKRSSVSQNNGVSSFSNKTSSLGREAANSTYLKPVTNNGRTLERPTRFSNRIVSPPLAPIGTPSINTDVHADTRPYAAKSSHTGSIPVISTNGSSLVPALSFEKNNMSLNSVPTSLSPWGDGRMNKQVMALTQTQLDEAMKPARFEKHVASNCDRNGAVIDPNKLSSSIVTQDKSFSTTVSPLNSLLAGERIQFGAVTSPTILPSSSQISNRMGSLSSGLEDDCSLFFEKDKHLNESCVDLEEAEAEAAASAVAVAAFSNDEIVTSGCSGSVTETISFGDAEKEGLAPEGTVSDQQVGSQSRAEESLSVALPADLSLETPSLSMWPSLPSPQHSSGQMLSHFPGGTPSHFPFYEMNPMLGGPIFAFAPHDESAGTQSHTSSASGSRPLGTWQQCHSGVDSFYGPPAGFTGPFISPSGGIPGVQCPPHMVVYNHFTPVGQFGQVGLSFMGATYIPSGKQPDWKHNPASSTMGFGDVDINSLNIPSAQHNPSSMPPPIQHPAPGSPLLPMASPLAMFDMSPFQSSTDIPVQARWSHFPASHHSAPMSMPLPQHPEGMSPSQFSHGSPIDQSTGNRFEESCSSAALDGGRNFPMESCASVTQFPDELGLIDTSNTSTSTTRVAASRTASYSSTIMNGKAQTVVTKNSKNTAANFGDSSSKNSNSKQSMNSSIKTHSAQQQTSGQQYLSPSGYTDERGVGVSHNVASGAEWAHRRMGFHGRNQSSGTEKKVKQIYVAKPVTSRTPTNLSS